jgi:ketosteroid isomerase-like protein
MQPTQVAEALFDALARGDADGVRRLCAADLTLRQNNNEPMDLDALLGFALAVHGAVKDFRYENVVRASTETGFVEEHSVRGTLPDGSPLDLAACVVADVRDGKVTDVREYVDGVAAAGLISALA